MSKGIPLFGDRSAWDALTYAARHTNDTDNGIHWTLTKLQELFAGISHTHAHFTDTSNPHSVTKAQVGLGNVANVLCNLTGTAAPGVSDDSTAGYSVGSWWFYDNKYYDCLDATSGAAVWQERGSGSGGSITVEEIDGTPSVASVSTIKVTNGKLTDNGSGTVTLDLGGGSSSGDSSILGYCSSTSNSVVDPDPATDTDVDSMSISLTLSATKLVVITIRIIKSGSHPDRYAIYDGATKIFPVNGISSGYYDHSSAENGEYSITHVCYVSLASGSHTIKVKHQAAQSTSSITFKERWMVITDGSSVGADLPIDALAHASVGSGDHFAGTTLDSGWTDLQTTAVTSKDRSIADYLILRNTGNTGGKSRGVKRAFAPSGDFTIWCKINAISLSENYQWGGLFIGASDPSDASGGKRLELFLVSNNGIHCKFLKVNSGAETAVFDVTSFPEQTMSVSPRWLRIRRSGTTLYAGLSVDGIEFTEHSTTTTIDFTVATCGLFIAESSATSNIKSIFDYIATA